MLYTCCWYESKRNPGDQQISTRLRKNNRGRYQVKAISGALNKQPRTSYLDFRRQQDESDEDDSGHDGMVNIDTERSQTNNDSSSSSSGSSSNSSSSSSSSSSMVSTQLIEQGCPISRAAAVDQHQQSTSGNESDEDTTTVGDLFRKGTMIASHDRNQKKKFRRGTMIASHNHDQGKEHSHMSGSVDNNRIMPPGTRASRQVRSFSSANPDYFC